MHSVRSMAALLLCVCAVLLAAAARPAARTIFLELSPPTEEEVGFLQRYGYMEATGAGQATFTPHSIAEAVRRMQRFAGLPQTGLIDHRTKMLFKKKRCGVKDVESGSTARSRRYIIQQGWDKTTITYKVVNGTGSLSAARVEAVVAAALAVWAPHGGLRFSRQDHGRPDIAVSFASGDHGDGFPFDGPGRVVAHAFPPPHGSIHLDADEVWGVDPSHADSSEMAASEMDASDMVASDEDADVTDLFAVVVHEVGHALGLSHSDVRASVMYPYYQVPVETLHMDDILAMQELYLKKQERWSEETTQSVSVPRFTKAASDEQDELPDLCMTNYDTLQVVNNKIYVFEEEWVWVLRDRGVLEAGFPQRFHDVFRGLPARVATVRTLYQRFNGNVVIFSGRQFWEFAATVEGGDSFRLVHRGAVREYSLPRRVELTNVFISNYNNKTYLIEDERFWRYDEGAREMDPGYPKDMSAWRNVPYPVDAALVWRGDTYFFQGPRFWRFDNRVVAAHPYYPLPVAQIWFDCVATPEMNNYVTNERL